MLEKVAKTILDDIKNALAEDEQTELYLYYFENTFYLSTNKEPIQVGKGIVAYTRELVDLLYCYDKDTSVQLLNDMMVKFFIVKS